MAKKKLTASPAPGQEIPLVPSPARDNNNAKAQEEELKIDEDIVADMIDSDHGTIQETERNQEIEEEDVENDYYTLGGEG